MTGNAENQAIYKALTEDKKKVLMDEFKKEKATKLKALRTSMKSHINDISQTVKLIENKVSCNITAISCTYNWWWKAGAPSGAREEWTQTVAVEGRGCKWGKQDEAVDGPWDTLTKGEMGWR